LLLLDSFGFPEFEILDSSEFIWLVEGGPDYLALWDFILARELDVTALPVAILGRAVKTIHEEALKFCHGKRIRIFAHVDKDSGGLERAREWGRYFVEAGCAQAEIAHLEFLRKSDGSPIKDVNDRAYLDPSQCGELEQLFSLDPQPRLEMLHTRASVPPGSAKDYFRLFEEVKNNAQAREENDEFQDIGSEQPFPTLDKTALYGLFGEVVDLLAPATEADPVAILVQLLLAFGNIVGRSPYFYVEAAHHHANLFACLVGRSAKGRKGTSHNHIIRLAREIDSEWVSERTGNGLSSGEGLIWAVRDAIFEPERNKKTGEVTEVKTDNGVEDKRLYIAETEFAQALKVMSRPTNILSSVIRTAWDTGDLRTLVKNNPARATGAHITIVGHITQEELKRELTQCELFNGFANRFLWIAVKRSKLLPDGGILPSEEFARIVRKVREIIARARAIGEMKRDGEARRHWHEIYPKLSGESIGLTGSVCNRAEAQALRLSILYALSDGSSTIELKH
jgi:hypothetical protein